MGHVQSDITYTYSPEALFPVIADLFHAFRETLGTPAYAIITQGVNAYAKGNALHLSPSGNHISLNALGLPFAQLLAIDKAVRQALREGSHQAAELYLDSTFFRSLNLKFEFDKNRLWKYGYRSPITKALGAGYVVTSLDEIKRNLK